MTPKQIGAIFVGLLALFAGYLWWASWRQSNNAYYNRGEDDATTATTTPRPKKPRVEVESEKLQPDVPPETTKPPRPSAKSVDLLGVGYRLAFPEGDDPCRVAPVATGVAAVCRCPEGAAGPQNAVVTFAFPAEVTKVRCAGKACVGRVEWTVSSDTSKVANTVWHVKFTPNCNPVAPLDAAAPYDESKVGASGAQFDTVRNATFVRVNLDVSVRNSTEVHARRMCFISVGDWGGGANSNWPSVARTITAYIKKRIDVKFVVSTGDNFYPTGVTGLKDPKWKLVFETPMSDPVLQGMRFYVIAGNHDEWGLPPQLEYGRTHERWYFPSRYWVDVLPGGSDPSRSVALVGLDAYHKDFFSTQFHFLRQLAERDDFSKAGWRIMINHVPLYSGSHHGREGFSKNCRAKLSPVLSSMRFQGYINGDDHVLEVLRDTQQPPVDYFVSGGGGGSSTYSSSKLAETVYLDPNGRLGFMNHCVGPDDMITEVVDVSGKLLFTHTTPRV